MKKKLVSLVLAVTMLAASVCSAFAATDVATDTMNVNTLISAFADKLPDEDDIPEGKVKETLEYLQMYMSTDKNMETLINNVENDALTDLPAGQTILANMNAENKASLLFVLELLRAIPAENRAKALEDYMADIPEAYVPQDTDEPTFNDAMVPMFQAVYPDKLFDALATYDQNGIQANYKVVLNLFTAWKDTIRLTDNKSGEGFAAYEVDEDYAERLMENVEGYTLNGKKITDAMQVAEELADVLNRSYSADVIANMKIVLGDSGLGIYVSKDSVAEMDRIEVDGTKIDLSMKKNNPTKVKVNKSYVTVEGFAASSDMDIDYAYVDDMTKWYDDMEDVKMTVGSTKKIAVRVTSKDGKNSEIYYVTLSRPSSDSSSSSSSNNRRPSSSITTTPESTIPTPPVSSTTFSDTENHWGKDYISAMVSRGIFEGYEDGTFKPDNGVTRQEMAVILVRLLGLESELGTVTDLAFTDAYDIAEWAQKAVALLSAKGIYLGYDDGEFKPNRVLTREEIVALTMRIFGETYVDSTLNFKDAERIGEWARKAVGQATTLEIISGRDDGTFEPGASVTRAEAAKILYNYMHVKGIY